MLNKTPLRPINIYTSDNVKKSFTPSSMDIDMLVDAYTSPDNKASIKSNESITPKARLNDSSITDSSHLQSPSIFSQRY